MDYSSVLDAVDEYIKEGNKSPTHIFVDPFSFRSIIEDMCKNNYKYWLPKEYENKTVYSFSGTRELTLIHANGRSTIEEVLLSRKFLLIGNEKSYCNYVAEKELLGE